jgi:hypothetical protein
MKGLLDYINSTGWEVVQAISGAHQSSYFNEYYKVFLPKVKSLGLKVDHLPSASTEVKKEWSILVLLPYTLMARTGTN